MEDPLKTGSIPPAGSPTRPRSWPAASPSGGGGADSNAPPPSRGTGRRCCAGSSRRTGHSGPKGNPLADLRSRSPHDRGRAGDVDVFSQVEDYRVGLMRPVPAITLTLGPKRSPIMALYPLALKSTLIWS